jgi:hypothetical protein
MKITSYSESDIAYENIIEEFTDQCRALSDVFRDINNAFFYFNVENLSSVTSISGKYGPREIESLLKKLSKASADLRDIAPKLEFSLSKVKGFTNNVIPPLSNIVQVLQYIKHYYPQYKSDWIEYSSKLSEDDKFYSKSLIDSVETIITNCEANMRKIDEVIKALNLPEGSVPILMP